MKHANIAIFVPHVGCPNQCSFCNQHSISGTQTVPDGATVTATCNAALLCLGARAKTAELAFFGGSFTAIPRPLMLELLQAAHPFVADGRIAGIRLSTRPDAITDEILALLRCYGVTAVELGAQSMDDGVLHKNLRGHTAQDVATAARLIKAHGFNLVLQMMTGLYGDTEQKTLQTAREIAALKPDAVRIYPTVVIKGTMLAELYEQGLYTPPAAHEAVQTVAKLLEFFAQQGILVIRVGLHASRELERDMLAGGYHPALRELCEAHIFLNKFLAYLDNHPALAGNIIINVPVGCASKAAGQHRANLLALQARGLRVKLLQSSALTGCEFTITTPFDESKGVSVRM